LEGKDEEDLLKDIFGFEKFETSKVKYSFKPLSKYQE
jgi:hypothetical protein